MHSGITQRSPSRVSTLLLLVAGFGLFAFTRRSNLVPTIPAAIVAAPILILRFSRTLPTGRAIVLTIAGFVLSMNVALWGLFGLDDAASTVLLNVVRSTLLALLYAVPYVVDRVITPRLGDRPWTTLVFPVAVTAIMFLSSLEGPFDGTTAKNVYATGPLVLLQIYAITGLWGFVFLWSWVASLINFAWERRFAARSTLIAAASFCVVFGAIVLYGGVRLYRAPEGETVTLAAVVLIPEDGTPVSMERLNAERITVPYAETLRRIEALTAEAANHGARIVSFQEYAMTIGNEDVARLRADYARIASECGVWLSVTYARYADQGKGANIHVLIDDRGRIRADYQKRYLLGLGPFGETGVFSKGEEIIQTVDTPYGRIAVSICRDMSFPAFARQAGRMGADIMLTPSYDFPASRGLSDSGRAIDTGFTHVRPTYNGISYAMDPYGRVLARMASADGGNGIMYAELPTRGARTLYARFGDWFGWLTVAALAFFAVRAVVSRRAER